MRKNHPTSAHLTARVATRRRNSLPNLALNCAPRTPRKCPQGIEIRPAIRLWYVQRIVSRLSQNVLGNHAAAKLEKRRNLNSTRLGHRGTRQLRSVRPKHHFHDFLSAHARKIVRQKTAGKLLLR